MSNWYLILYWVKCIETTFCQELYKEIKALYKNVLIGHTLKHFKAKQTKHKIFIFLIASMLLLDRTHGIKQHFHEMYSFSLCINL